MLKQGPRGPPNRRKQKKDEIRTPGEIAEAGTQF